MIFLTEDIELAQENNMHPGHIPDKVCSFKYCDCTETHHHNPSTEFQPLVCDGSLVDGKEKPCCDYGMLYKPKEQS